ncbi:hypothetical protein [Planktomarina sp.]|uniref:hypothetical protein n=1 Tax=Planktomarina sp. TaxID=2024851 RepID=UPI003260E13A
MIIQLCLIGFGVCLGGGAVATYLIRQIKADERFLLALLREMREINPVFNRELEIAFERIERAKP